MTGIIGRVLGDGLLPRDALGGVDHRIDPELAVELRAIVGQSRRGSRERGYSMTLGRLFDPGDRGLLLAGGHARADRRDQPAARRPQVEPPGGARSATRIWPD